jgi:hypothetical protein
MNSQHDRLPWPVPAVPCQACIEDESRRISQSAAGDVTLYCPHHLVYAALNYHGVLPVWSCHSPTPAEFMEVLLSKRPSLLRRWRERQAKP